MKIGDKVKFVGDKMDYISSFRGTPNRIGEIIPLAQGDSERAGVVRVRWIPKTCRGHKVSELEVIEL